MAKLMYNLYFLVGFYQKGKKKNPLQLRALDVLAVLIIH